MMTLTTRGMHKLGLVLGLLWSLGVLAAAASAPADAGSVAEDRGNGPL